MPRSASIRFLGIAFGLCSPLTAAPCDSTSGLFDTLEQAAYRCVLAYASNAEIQHALPCDSVFFDSLQFLTDYSARESRKAFVAVDRIGKKQWVVFRGTNTPHDWLVDGDHGLVFDSVLKFMVHRGFKEAVDGLYAQIRPQLDPDFDIYVAGHSLGGAIAVLTAAHIRMDSALGPRLRRCFTVGQPKVTNQEGAEALRALRLPLLRVVNNLDPVPRVPPADFFSVFAQAPNLSSVDSRSVLVERLPDFSRGLVDYLPEWSLRPFYRSHYFTHDGPAVHLSRKGIPDCREEEPLNDWMNPDIWIRGFPDHSSVAYDSLLSRLAGRFGAADSFHIRPRPTWINPPSIFSPYPELKSAARDAFLIDAGKADPADYQVRLNSLAADGAGLRRVLAESVIEAGSARRLEIRSPERLMEDNGYIRYEWKRLHSPVPTVPDRGALLLQPRPGHILQFWGGMDAGKLSMWRGENYHPDFSLYAGSRWLTWLSGSADLRFFSIAGRDMHAFFFPSANDMNPLLRGTVFRSDFYADAWLPGPQALVPGLSSGFGFTSTPDGRPGQVELRPRVFLGVETPRNFFPEEWLRYRLAFAYDALWKPSPYRWDCSVQADFHFPWLLYPGFRLDVDLPWNFSGPASFRAAFLVGMDLGAVASVFRGR